MGEIELPENDDIFFDKDHIVFYSDDHGDVNIKFAIYDDELFQNLILSVLSGSLAEPALDFLIKEMKKQGLKDEAVSMMVIKKLLTKGEEDTPIVKPSSFR